MAWGTEGEIRPRWLRCSVQNYDWGRRGKDSTVAKLFSANSESEAEFDKSYAEFWMGTHESGPSFLVPEEEGKGDGEGGEMVRLKDWIRENPNVIGMKVVDKWGYDLPFLFKVLSVSKALSIQAHPDKELAMMLHKLKPTVYKDDNHKPEMAVAITKFKALYGFISLQELKTVLKSVPEIAEFVGRKETSMILEINDQIHVGKVKDVLRAIFTRFMTADENTISKLIYKLKGRLSSADKIGMLTEKERLALKLEKQYPGDVGVVSSFFFNYVKLKPGEALYLGPNEPHAYLSGECIECMATSDNVVRAGLTPKFRDVHTLCSMLTYKQGFPEILKGIPLNRYISRYTPPFDEFEVDSCFLPSKESVVFPAALGPSLFVILNGDGDVQFDSSKEKDAILEGDVLFVPEKTQITITAGAIGDLQLYRAGVNQKFFE